MNPFDESTLLKMLSKRYAGADANALMAVMCPLLIPIMSLDKKIFRVFGQSHYRASFSVRLTPENHTVLQVGRTGKFVPYDYVIGGSWNEIVKGRILNINYATGVAEGEIYTGESSIQSLKSALDILKSVDFLEIDQYGASAKILSALAEYSLVKHGKERGYEVIRMPEDMAKHLGAYPNFDFLFIKNGETQRVEAKSLWGTNTSCARLIHSTTTPPNGSLHTWTEDQIRNYYPTSSCKFSTQDIFAVSLFLRTGNINDFAFARSIPNDVSIHGLPRVPKYTEHVTQNPTCIIDHRVWFQSIDEVWNLR